MHWSHEKEVTLFNLVNSYGSKNSTIGLRAAAEEMGISYFVARNRWYHQNLKELRNSVETPVLVSETTDKIGVKEAMQSLYDAIENELQALRDDNMRLIDANYSMSHELTSLQGQYDELKEEYSVIHRVISIAREISVKEKLGEKTETRFKMEKNGNLETIKERYFGQPSPEAVGV